MICYVKHNTDIFNAGTLLNTGLNYINMNSIVCPPCLPSDTLQTGLVNTYSTNRLQMY